MQSGGLSEQNRPYPATHHTYGAGDALNRIDPSGRGSCDAKDAGGQCKTLPNDPPPPPAPAPDQNQECHDNTSCSGEISMPGERSHDPGAGGSSAMSPTGPTAPQGPGYFQRVANRIAQTNHVLNPFPNGIGKHLNPGGQGMIGALDVQGKIKDM
jgi:hypothetical protein